MTLDLKLVSKQGKTLISDNFGLKYIVLGIQFATNQSYNFAFSP